MKLSLLFLGLVYAVAGWAGWLAAHDAFHGRTADVAGIATCGVLAYALVSEWRRDRRDRRNFNELMSRFGGRHREP